MGGCEFTDGRPVASGDWTKQGSRASSLARARGTKATALLWTFGSQFSAAAQSKSPISSMLSGEAACPIDLKDRRARSRRHQAGLEQRSRSLSRSKAPRLMRMSGQAAEVNGGRSTLVRARRPDLEAWWRSEHRSTLALAFTLSWRALSTISRRCHEELRWIRGASSFADSENPPHTCKGCYHDDTAALPAISINVTASFQRHQRHCWHGELGSILVITTCWRIRGLLIVETAVQVRPSCFTVLDSILETRQPSWRSVKRATRMDTEPG